MARALPILIVLLPVLLTLSYVYSFALETPWQDDWDLYMVPFQHQAAGQLTWSDVTAQHNESIPIFPTAASLILARIFGGLLLPVTYLSYLCLCGSVLILYLFFRQLRLPGRWSTLWFLPIALLFLGWRQSEALLWSTHLLNSMALFFVLASLYCCTQAGRAPIFFAGAVLCAWIASFSMASGLLVWFSGAVALAFPPAGKARSTDIVRRVAGWLAIAATCALCFFMGYTANHASWPTGLDYVLANAGSAAQYILIYLGGPLGAKPSIAKVAGEVLLAIGLAILVFAWRRIREKGFPAPLLLSLYVFTAAFPLVSGRLGLGIEQSFAPRYVTAAALFSIGIYLCCLELAKTIPACRYLSIGMAVLLSFGIVNSYAFGIVIGPKEWQIRNGCAADIRLFRVVDRQRLATCYPDPNIIRERGPAMVEYRISLFAE